MLVAGALMFVKSEPTTFGLLNCRYKKTDNLAGIRVGCGRPDLCEERTDDLRAIELQIQKNRLLSRPLSWLREPDLDLRPAVIERSPRAQHYRPF